MTRCLLPQITRITQKIICENLRNLWLITPASNYEMLKATRCTLPQFTRITQKIICENLCNLWLKTTSI